MKLFKSIKAKIKKTLLDLSAKNRFFLVLYRKLMFLNNRLQYLAIMRQYSLMENLILMDSMGGKVFACNIAPLYQEMARDEKYSGYRFVWAFKEPNKYTHLKKENHRLEIVKYGSREHKIAMARSKYIFASSGLPNYYIRRKDQVFFQAWHGTPLKKLGCDIETEGSAVFTSSEWRKKYRADAKRFSYLLAPSDYTAEKLSSAFDLRRLGRESIIYKEGYPRNDVLYNFSEQDVKRIKEKIGVPENKKVILYAPTFRDSDFERGKGFFFKTPVSFDFLREKLPDDCVILFRPHVNVASRFNLKQYSQFVYNVAAYPNIADLYIISDLLVTDYSSVIFDYANLKRPMVFYLYDLEEYNSNIRGLYFSVEELPGEIALTEEELVKSILQQLHGFQYDEKYHAFNERFNPWDGPDCSKRIIEKIVPRLEAVQL